MSDIKAPFTLIWFYNAGCGECARIKAQIEATGYLDMLHSAGILEVLALYPDGELENWRKALPENPSWWISAYDKGQVIQRQNLYDLKAIPTIYLLDAQKRVVLKDPTVEVLIGVLKRICYGG
ncbi:MAG: thioredoxin family protein [Tidjanibacter sp.]|nr:thioredoxin family protein [Tidjanibacter sp.]